MHSLTLSCLVFVFVFGGALLGMFLRKVLPVNHLDSESRDTIKVGMALVATMCALVLSLLISSAKSFYDAQSAELTVVSSNIILLDRTLAHYGPEADPPRKHLRMSVEEVVKRAEGPMTPDSHAVSASNHRVDTLFDLIQDLSPKDDRQRAIQSQALSVLAGLQQTRWLIFEQELTSVSIPLFVVLIAWLTFLFISFGLFAPVNATVVGSLFVSAFSAAGAVFLILEMYSPYRGLIRISIAPLRAALAQLGV